MPTLPARPNPQLWYTSSAGHYDSEVLRLLRDRGQRGDAPSLAYLEWSADPALDITSDEAVYQSNPALGIRINREHVEREREALTEPEFKRERLGLWEEPDAVDGVLPVEAWLRLYDQRSMPLDPVTFGVDVSPDGSASIASAGVREDGLLHVEVVENRPGTSWVVDRVSELRSRWNPAAIVLDVGSPAGALVPEFDRAGVPLTKLTGRDMAASAVSFAALVTQGGLRHLDQPMLNAAVASARRRYVGDSWAFGRRGSFVDISPLVACSLAAWGHAQSVGREPQIIDIWSMEDAE